MPVCFLGKVCQKQFMSKSLQKAFFHVFPASGDKHYSILDRPSLAKEALPSLAKRLLPFIPFNASLMTSDRALKLMGPWLGPIASIGGWMMELVSVSCREVRGVASGAVFFCTLIEFASLFFFFFWGLAESPC